MAEAPGAEPQKQLSLEDIQAIIGRSMVDHAFRDALVADPEGTLHRMGISLYHAGKRDEKAQALVGQITDALSSGGQDLSTAMTSIRSAYLASTDGVIRPACGLDTAE